TGLPEACADVVTCVQAFHWMDPEIVLPEVARILRPGGVFAAVDYDATAVRFVPPKPRRGGWRAPDERRATTQESMGGVSPPPVVCQDKHHPYSSD
ncbi:MAG: class I SAM-dependent methyltransferase, partial [Candidatus Dormibacteraceae bacterium]